jgi:DNA ligase-1
MSTAIKKDARGRDRVFEIRVEALRDGTANIIKTTGLVDGKKSTSVIHVPLGYESAKKRAATMLKNQEQEGILPMLAHTWEGKTEGPFYVQPKLDGVRILVSRQGGISRTGKVVPGTAHWGAGLGPGEYLDGECYVHGMAFEDITSAFKTRPETLEFHVFDYFDTRRPSLPFEARRARATVPTVLVPTKRDIEAAHASFVAQGYEGIMIRDPQGVYEPGKRSKGLLKYKHFETDEFTIVGVHEGAGKDKGTPVWECVTPGGERFSVRPEGSLAMRREAFENRQGSIGKPLTVRYQNMTAAGVPRFPVGLGIRDYEPSPDRS